MLSEDLRGGAFSTRQPVPQTTEQELIQPRMMSTITISTMTKVIPLLCRNALHQKRCNLMKISPACYTSVVNRSCFGSFQLDANGLLRLYFIFYFIFLFFCICAFSSYFCPYVRTKCQ